MRPAAFSSALLSGALFLAAFWVSSRALAAVFPSRGTTLIETKLTWYEENGAPYDTLFFGSSRCYRGFSPELFDRLTGEQGLVTNSFNFGTPGSRAFEIFRMLERLERMDHSNVKWVLVDPEAVEWLLHDKQQLMASYIDWHDPATTWLVLRYLSVDDMELGFRLDRAQEHVQSLGFNLANINATEAFVAGLMGRHLEDRTRQIDRLGPRLDGWLPHNDELASTDNLKKHRRFLGPTRQERYGTRVERLREDEVEDSPSTQEAVVFYTRIQARIEELGATPIFVTQPGVTYQHQLIKAHREGKIRYLLRYDDPDQVPELFAVEHRWDIYHSNEAGAVIFTELLARDFAQIVGRIARETESDG